MRVINGLMSGLLTVAVVFLACSCGQAEIRGLEQELAGVRRLADTARRYELLVGLHLRYPQRADVLRALGNTAYNLGHYPVARAYLLHARHIESRQTMVRREAGWWRDTRFVGDNDDGRLDGTDLLLARIALGVHDYRSAALHATVALQRGGGDEARLVRARAAIGAADYLAALSDYDEISHLLSYDDMSRALVGHRAVGDYSRALSTLQTRMEVYGYHPGHGIEQARYYEWLGRPDLAVAASLMETEYLRFHRRMPDDQLRERLMALAAGMGDDREGIHGPSATAVDLVTAYHLHMDEKWEKAAGLLSALEQRLDHPFVRYASLVSRVRSGLRREEDLARYGDLEPLFHTTQFYYYHLWRILQQVSPGYSILTVRELLERSILLSPGSHAAAESRTELGRLLGLSAAEAALLLLGPELETLIAAVRAYRDPRLLDTILDALSLPETPYTLAAIIALQAVMDVETVSAYLHDAARERGGIAGQRLSVVLGTGRPEPVAGQMSTQVR